ncbi:MAG: tRNA (adenosine(37)-N6)-threonylcarbamoyltransferase complex ATPase subunit type 1 TsaE, partial [Spirochaetales bacterium]|nr:tRNA (adenosine(37)-N6)-threonylcarbamoyltransferase complex ATPase subunit type 1 TsaE [Spirochaetales bacterium]
TQTLGRSVASRLAPGSIVCLSGELGTGKSVLARGIARALGVADRMPSPSYTLVEEYVGRLPVLHIDLYRIADEAEFGMLGIEEEMVRSVSLVEWPERAPTLFKEAHVTISLSLKHEEPDGRTITVAWRDDASRLGD